MFQITLQGSSPKFKRSNTTCFYHARIHLCFLFFQTKILCNPLFERYLALNTTINAYVIILLSLPKSHMISNLFKHNCTWLYIWSLKKIPGQQSLIDFNSLKLKPMSRSPGASIIYVGMWTYHVRISESPWPTTLTSWAATFNLCWILRCPCYHCRTSNDAVMIKLMVKSLTLELTCSILRTIQSLAHRE